MPVAGADWIGHDRENDRHGAGRLQQWPHVRAVTGGIIRARVENRTEARGTGAHMLHRYYCDEELLKRA